MKETLLNEINRRFPPGTLPVKYRKADGTETEALVRWPAERLEGGKEVIWIKDEPFAIDLKQVII